MAPGDFEHQDAFYLGNQDAGGERLPVLLESGDLTTHAAIIGMTGSGKTGLGIGLIEEAALDGIPVIAVDPKGDLGNLLLTFPGLDGASFEPWVDPRAAESEGLSRSEYAARQAALWKQGLAGDGQDGARIRRLREAVSMAIYTPGSSAGLPLSVLANLRPPGEAVRNDAELFGDQLAAAATSLLALMGIEADPMLSREHILISTVLKHHWSRGDSLDLPALIRAIQEPPFDTVGVLKLGQFYPQRERFELALRLNNLLAAPGFSAWLQGSPLDAGALLRTEAGKPRVSVMYLSHLSDVERMFFVCMLLNELIDWMRRQPGTGSLRALLYMDEVFGYLPPVAAPPSKALFLTLLKQARAYGLGLVLSTQNPVDLDYKALSNCGSWFLGRLQTERDKKRVMAGLEGVRVPGGLDRGAMEATLAGLDKRQFLLHSVHRDAPTIFFTRWVMSYLAGPLTRDQVSRLMADAPRPAVEAAPPPVTPASPGPGKPLVPGGVDEYFLPAPADSPARYRPVALGLVELSFDQRGLQLGDTRRRLLVAAPFGRPPLPVRWEQGEILDLAPEALGSEPPQAEYGALPDCVDAALFDTLDNQLETWVYNTQALEVLHCERLDAVSRPDENEADFRGRLAELLRAAAGDRLRELDADYAQERRGLQQDLDKAQARLEREQLQRSRSRTDALMAAGNALLSLFGGRSVGSKARSTAHAAGGWRSQAEDVEQAEARVASLRQELELLTQRHSEQQADLRSGDLAAKLPLETLRIGVDKGDIQVRFVALGWQPVGEAGAA